MNSQLLMFILCCVVIFNSVLTCNNYKLKINHLKNCDSSSLVQTKNVSVKLSNDCFIAAKGCLNVIKSFKSAKAEYKIKKALIPELSGKIDLCKEAKTKNKIGLALAIIGFKCPMKAGLICATGSTKMDISKYKNRIGIAAGVTDVMVEIEHDNGKSCFDLQIELNQ